MTIRRAHYEEMTYFKSAGKLRPGLFYVQSTGIPKLVDEAKARTYAWMRGYFFVKISPESVEDVKIANYTGWKISPGSLNSFSSKEFPFTLS